MKFKPPLLALLLLPALSLFWIKQDPPEPSTVKETDMTVPEAIPLLEYGVFEANVLANIPSPSRGFIAEVKEDGTLVEPGELLVRLDDEFIVQDLETKQRQLEQQEEALENGLQELAVLTNQYAQVARLEVAELAHAELRLEQAKTPLSPEEERLLEIDIELSELDILEAEEALSRQQELVTKGFAPASSLEKPTRDLKTRRTRLAELRTQLLLAKEPLPPQEILTRQSEVDKAKDTVLRSRSLHERELRIQKLNIEGTRLKIESSQGAIARLEQDLGNLRVTAPMEGLFLVIQKYGWGSRRWQPLGVGTRVWEMDIVGQIVDPHDLQLRVLVHESDRERVQPGTQGEVELTAFPGTSYPTRVISITSVGQDRDDLSPVHQQAPPVNQALFLAILDVDLPADVPVKPGMTARILLSPEGAK